jgi:hypothetical protein
MDGEREMWQVDLSDEHSYMHPPAEANYVLCETVLVSPDANWAVLVSDWFHALLGSTDAFVNDVAANIDATREEMLNQFATWWRRLALMHGGKTDWIHPQIAHMYDSGTAERVISQVSKSF